MFVLTIPLLEKIIRPILIYLILVIGLRLAGKRELAQLNAFDLVVLLTLSNTVQNAIIGNDNTVVGGVVGAATLLILNFFVVRVVYKNNKIEQLVEGSEVVLIKSGKIVESAMNKEGISMNELLIAAHKQGFSTLAEVEKAVLEPEGGISFIGRKPEPDVLRHQELLRRLDQLSVEVAALRTEVARQKNGKTA
jgi:uncharacterized membrane protein YcaP (DUF421 family)